MGQQTSVHPGGKGGKSRGVLTWVDEKKIRTELGKKNQIIVVVGEKSWPGSGDKNPWG